MEPNFLVLDEVTNDLDLQTLTLLENFLLDYKGVLVVVSHDRFFMDRITNHLFVFEGQVRVGRCKVQHAVRRRQCSSWRPRSSVPGPERPLCDVLTRARSWTSPATLPSILTTAGRSPPSRPRWAPLGRSNRPR